MKKNALIVLLFLLEASCVKKAIPPAYLKIEKFNLKVDTMREGSSSHAIIDAWLYGKKNTENTYKLIGVFGVPAVIPLPGSGIYDLKIFPGIMKNGQVEVRTIYPFYTYRETSLFLKTMDTTYINSINISYRGDISFLFIEDFEGPGLIFSPSQYNKGGMLILTYDTVFEGKKSGKILFGPNPEDTIFLYETNKSFQIVRGAEVYLEINYWNYTSLTIGIVYYLNAEKIVKPLILLKDSYNWKKIYISLTNYLAPLPDTTKYMVYIGAIKMRQNDFALLDNIKLITGI